MSATSSKTVSPAVWITIPLVLAFIYIYPRVLIANLGEANPWTSYFYQYGFRVGLLSHRDLVDPETRGPAGWAGAVTHSGSGSSFVGFLFFAIGHAVWIVLALNVPYLGG